MPNIRQIVAKDVSLNPSETGTTAVVNNARRIAGVYGDIAQMQQQDGRSFNQSIQAAGDVFVQYAEHREISQGSATFAETQATLSQLWNEHAKNADPNDAETAVRFQKDVLEPALEQWRGAFVTARGQDYAENRVSRLREHMFEKTRSDMATLAGEAAQVNMRTMSNQLSVMVRADPTSLDMALETLNHGVGAMFDSSPNLTGPQASAARTKISQAASEAIVKAAVFGAIEKNPTEGLKLAQDPKYSKYITGMEVGQFEREARAQERMALAEQRYAEMQRKEQKQKLSEDTVKAMVDNLYSPNSTLTIQNVRDAKDQLSLQHFEHILGMVERRSKPDPRATVSAETSSALLERMWLPEGDDRKVTTLDPIREEMIAGRLSKADFNFLNEQFDRASTPDGSRLSTQKKQLMDAVKPLFDKPSSLVPITDPESRLKLMQFMKQVDGEIMEARKNGKDPQAVIDKYSGPNMMQHLSPWQASLQDIMKKQAERMRAPSPATTAPTTPVVTTTPTAPSVPKPTGFPEDAVRGDDGKYRVIRNGVPYIVMPKGN